MNILVIPDIHTHHEKAERICQKYKDHKIVFIGDYFDQFNDSVEDNMFTAEWLKESLGKQNRIHLRGNHDEHYDPRVSSICSGYSNQKKAGINKVLSIEDWDKLKYFHFENKWLFSHAGVNQYWFGNPV
jgi:metallophosphoesterase superfamily enzyme